MSERAGRLPDVDVCVCTYRRLDTLARVLGSLAAQELPDDLAIRVIVADNDDVPSAAALVREHEEAGLRVSYRHAPARNISVARNACLDAAVAPWIAFIDDDEIAPPGWLAALVARQRREDAPIVLGPVRADYGAELPAWLKQADLHSTRPAVRRDGSIDTGYSCNVLFSRIVADGHRFDPLLGRTGGEDDVFFSTLARQGHRIAFAPDAWLAEPVTPARASLRWLLRRSFRNGQTIAGIRLAAGQGRPVLTGIAAGKLLACVGQALAHVGSAPGWRRAIVRGALHAGAVGRALGKRELEIY